MNHPTRTVIVALGLVVLGQADAQSSVDLAASAQEHCRDVQGNLAEVFIPANNSVVGRLTNAGWLDGTTLAVGNSASFPTPDANKVSFSYTFTVSTGHGQLKARRVALYDVVTGLGTDLSDIDGSTSTGIFAGATGVLFANTFKSVTIAEGPYYALVVARICFAQGREPRDK